MVILAGHYVHTGQLVSPAGSHSQSAPVYGCHTRSRVVVFGSLPTPARKFLVLEWTRLTRTGIKCEIHERHRAAINVQLRSIPASRFRFYVSIFQA